MNAPSEQIGETSVASRLAAVRRRIAATAERAGRSEADVRLVVVTKEVTPGRAAEAIAAGATDLGENRAQELVAKQAGLGADGERVTWHFIGTLQRNKVRDVVGRAALIHSVDSVALGRTIASRASAAGRTQDVLLEVNIAGESSKHGLAPDDVPPALDALVAETALNVRGLMTIAPESDADRARATFRALRELRDELRGRARAASLVELSMGMTSDFEAAIEEGATMVRIGSAIFGPRGD